MKAEEPPVDVLAVARMAPLQDLVAKAVEMGREVQPGVQNEALLFIIGAFLGDPTLRTLSREDNMGIVLIEVADGSLESFLFLKLAENSPVSRALPNYGLHLHAEAGWTVATQEAASLQSVRGRVQALAALVNEPRSHDLEVAASGPHLAALLERAGRRIPSAEDEATEDRVHPFVAVLASELATCRTGGFGIDFSAKEARYSFYLEPEPDSAMHEWLTQDLPVDLSAAQWLEPGDLFSGFARTDSAAAQAWLRRLSERLADNGEEGAHKLVEGWLGLMAGAPGWFDGTRAATLSVDGDGFRFARVSTAAMTDEDLVAWLEKAREFIQDAAGEGVMSARLFSQLEIAERDCHGASVHRLQARFGSEEESVHFLPEYFETDRSFYFARTEKHLVVATDPDQICSLVHAIQAGVPPSPGMLDAVEPRPGEFFRGRIELVELLRRMAHDDFDPGSESDVADLPPVEVTGSVTDRKWVVEAVFPVRTMVALSRLQQYLRRPPSAESFE